MISQAQVIIVGGVIGEIGVVTHAHTAIEVGIVGGNSGFIVAASGIGAIGRDFAPVKMPVHNTSHKTQGEVTVLIGTECLVIVERGQYAGLSKSSSAGTVKKDLAAEGNEVVHFANGHFVFTIERNGFVSFGHTAPLIAVNSLNAVVASENTCQAGIA